MSAPLIVLDTMVIVSAVFSRETESSSVAVVHAVATGDARLAISDDQLSEIVRVMAYEGVEELVSKPVRAFEVALNIGTMGCMYHPRRLDWPSLSDPKDGWIFDLAFASGADYIVSYDHAVEEAGAKLGFEVLAPGELLETLRHRYEP